MALADLERDGHGYLVDLNQWDESIAADGCTLPVF
jgi:sulfur relay (sulfurtransferase) DsrC/TusE family protein